MEPLKVLEWLRKYGHASECHHVHSVYNGTFKTPNGETEGTLTIMQYRSRDGSNPCFVARVTTFEGKSAASNVETSIANALTGIHWNELG